jgi:hypothetical protein
MMLYGAFLLVKIKASDLAVKCKIKGAVLILSLNVSLILTISREIIYTSWKVQNSVYCWL